MSNFIRQAERIVTHNDLMGLLARVHALEIAMETGLTPYEDVIKGWEDEYREEWERNVQNLAQALAADHEFKVMIDAFSEQDYGEEE